MSDLRKLRQEQAELLKIASRLRHAIAAPTAPPIAELADLRRELTSTLIAHLRVEDDLFLPRLLASDDRSIASRARRFNDEMGGLAAAYSLYTQRWETMFIAANWSGFCHETRDILDALTHRIARERGELYPLLESLDRAA